LRRYSATTRPGRSRRRCWQQERACGYPWISATD
jgi:hypothetical protein